MTSPRTRYSERLWPSVWVWIAVLLVAASGGLVAVKVAPTWASVLVAAVCVAVAAWALVRSSATVAVLDDQLVAGRATIPVSLLGTIEVLDRPEFTRLRGPDADVRAYLCQRGWIPQGVRAEVVDPHDPTPYWLVSSRQPNRLAAALEGARDEPVTGASGDAAGGDASGQAHSRQTG